MAGGGWIGYPQCAPLEYTVEDIVKTIDPLWPVYFFIPFIVGGILGGLLAKCCFHSYMKKRQQDEEEKTLIAQGVPVRFIGKERTDIVQYNEQKSPSKTRDDALVKDARSTTPSAIDLEDLDPSSGLADALSQPTEYGADAELLNQDLHELTVFEERMLQGRFDAFILMLGSLISSKIPTESRGRLMAKLKGMHSDLVANNTSKTKLAMDEVTKSKQKQTKKGSTATSEMATQAEMDQIQAVGLQELNSELISMEDEVPALLRLEATELSEQDIEAIMKALKHQLATREKRVQDETARQLQRLEERLARRKEMSEQYKLARQNLPEIIEAKAMKQREALDLLVQSNKISQDDCDAVMEEYEKDLKRLHDGYEEERANQEVLLMEKLRKKRAMKMRKLSQQQDKSKQALVERLSIATETAGDTTLIKEYEAAMVELSDAAAQTTNELDAEELTKLSQMVNSVQQDFSCQFSDLDKKFYDHLKAAEVSDADVNKIIQLHKQEMKEFDRNRQNERKLAIAKLQEKLAERQQQRAASKGEEERTYQVIRNRQQETVQEVVNTQSDLSQDAVKMIMEEHERTMATLKNQLDISKVRQEKKLEQRIAERKAALAAKAKAAGKDNSKDGQDAVQQGFEEVEKEHQIQLAKLKERLADETKAALAAQEQHLSALIGQLEMGQARRKNILMKQEKLINELEKQLANKIDESPKGVTTTSELLQKHYSQVSNLTSALQTNRDRQEQVLQERLEQIKLQRKGELEQQMKREATMELENMRARGASLASSLLLDSMLKQRHEKLLVDLEKEMKLELQRARDEMNTRFNQELLSALSEEGKDFMANLAATNGLSNSDITEAMTNAAQAINANDKTVKRLAKEMKTRIKTAKGGRRQQQPTLYDDY